MNLDFRKYLILFGSLISIFILVNVIGTNSLRRVFIDGDGSGHYAYLPSLVIHKSVDFTSVFNFEKSQRPPDYMGHYFHKYGDIFINKYTLGTALLQLPFFLMGYILSLLFGLDINGYNIVFQYCIAISTIFWVTLGISYLVKFLGTYSIDKKFAWIISIVCLFGTNLFFYTFVQPSFSHAYSFSIITIFLYYLRKVFLDYSRYYIIISGFLFGLVILIRPANVIILAAVPFVSGSIVNLISAIKQKILNFDFLFAALAMIVALSPQLIINYMQTGNFIIYGYKNEGFYFTDPQILSFLFSYKKGWFVYTPLFLLLFPGLIYLWRSQTKFTFFSYIFFFGVVVYVFSSWWNWYYGDSFGMRPMVDYYSLFILVVALFLYNTCKSWVKTTGFVIISLAIILNLVQSYQYAIGIIHADSMTKKAYWHVFLDVSKESAKLISCGDETFYGNLSASPFFQTTNNIESRDLGWSNPSYTSSQVFYSDSLSIKQTPELIYSPSFKYFIVDTLSGFNNIYVRFNTKYLENEVNAIGKAVFVVDITDLAGKNVFYKSFRVKNIPDDLVDKWQEGSIGFKLPEITKEMDYVKFYIWNVGKQSYFLDDFEIMFYTYSH